MVKNTGFKPILSTVNAVDMLFTSILHIDLMDLTELTALTEKNRFGAVGKYEDFQPTI